MDRTRKPPVVLAIGGSDPCAGAGVQADLKTVHALGGYGLTVLSAVTVQNTQGVAETLPLPPRVVRDQLESLLADIEVGAVKTGMLATGGIAAEVAAALSARPAEQRAALVVDPVLVSSSGTPLLDEAGLEMLKERLLPLATLCTPNWPEAAILAGHPIETIDAAQEAAERILGLGPRAVLVTGGHAPAGAVGESAEGPSGGQTPAGSGERAGQPPVIDLLLSEGDFRRFEGPRIPGPSAHGTGCLIAAAIATGLAAGATLEAAIVVAKRLAGDSIARSLTLGRGAPIVDPFHRQRGSWLAAAKEWKT